MAKILQFRLPGQSASGNAGLRAPVKRDNPPPKRRKEPVVISAMPGDPFPFGHQDFRPLLQRDGLILLSWAQWEDWKGDGSLLQRYIVTWVASSQRRSYHYATEAIPKEELAKAVPERRADIRFYRGAYGSMWDIDSYPDKQIADYLYLAAPFDLDSKTIPAFIRILKSQGYTTDFENEFTLTKDNKSEAQKYLEKITAPKEA
jgi:hypothetical protein